MFRRNMSPTINLKPRQPSKLNLGTQANLNPLLKCGIQGMRYTSIFIIHVFPMNLSLLFLAPPFPPSCLTQHKHSTQVNKGQIKGNTVGLTEHSVYPKCVAFSMNFLGKGETLSNVFRVFWDLVI